jgi:NitT/TauT family transport system ATP-binding protein
VSGSVLSLDGVRFGYGEGNVLDGVDLDIPAASLTLLTGASGCGKSTLLALAAGLLAPEAGTVTRRCRRLAMVFQDPTLLPWRTAIDNVAFALKGQGLPAAERRARADAALDLAGLEREERDAYPRALSGGMRQRVALARALVVAPDFILCDEPFSALDAEARRDLWPVLADLRQRNRAALLIVSHDRDDAAFADRVVVLARGRIARAV